ncbi:DUF4221 family protein [Penaeicola halotolerans]|uniref:DUF4221 family protein n=1 Tax=Penaeicola halotolerans TaxID=2793196 RepID=UPI001CF8EACB|nr:DUF4221 family protein [Penaeicola halotolerans]
MKKYFYFLLTASVMFSACSGESPENQSSNFSFVWGDTLMVDTGDSFIDLSYGLNMADITADKRQMMHFSQKKNELSIINLDEMKLERQVQFDTDGPNSTENAYAMTVIGNGPELMLYSWNAFSKFNLDGIKLDKIDTRGSMANNSLSGDTLAEIETISARGTIDPSGRYYYGQLLGAYDDQGAMGMGQANGIAVIDLVNKSLKKVLIPELKKLSNYEMFIIQGQSAMIYTSAVYMWSDDEKLLISNSFANEVIIYHREADSVEIKSYESKLSANLQDPPDKSQSDNGKYIEQYLKTKDEQISFNEFVYDPDNKIFIRFSADTDLSKSTDDKKVKRNIITVFDQDLNMMQEAIIPEFTEASISNYFIKDGKIHFFQNLDDEVAFLTISIQK